MRTWRKAAILGDGQMGLLCAWILADAELEGVGAGPRPQTVALWGYDEQDIASVAQQRTSPRLAGAHVPDSVCVTASIDEAVEGADIVVCATPTQFIRNVFTRARGARGGLGADAAIVTVSKGIEIDTGLLPTQIILDTLGELAPAESVDALPTSRRNAGERLIAALSGPTIATELARGLPATMVAVSEESAFCEDVQRLFSTRFLRIYTHHDVVGVELAGAAKNVVAIAAGVLDGLDAGCNAKSALLARGMAEIARLGEALGADHDTFFGVAGVGDLATSCFSPHGRNRSCGEALGRGQSLEHHLASTASVVEGVATTRSIMALSKQAGVEMPIASAVHAVLYEHVPPIAAIEQLMTRPLKEEHVG